MRGHVTAYDTKTGKRVWRAYSMGPDSEILFDPEKTMSLGKPVGKDSSLKTWNGDQWKIGGGSAWGWYLLRSRAQPLLLRHRQPLDLEPGAARRTRRQADRPEVDDVDHRP